MGVAVKVTDVPAQIGFAVAAIDILAGRLGLIVTAKVLTALFPQLLPAVTAIFPF